MKLWGKTLYIVSVRDPIDIAISLRTWSGFPVAASLLIWQRYMSAILRCKEVAREALFIRYEDLIEDPTRECRRLCRYLNKKLELPLERIDEQVESMAKAVDSGLRRSRNNGDLDIRTSATRKQNALHLALENRLRSHGLTTRNNFDPDPGWREHLITVDVLRRFGNLIETEKLLQCFNSVPALYLKTFGLRQPTNKDIEKWDRISVSNDTIQTLHKLLWFPLDNGKE
jgi:hypothetical protein